MSFEKGYIAPFIEGKFQLLWFLSGEVIKLRAECLEWIEAGIFEQSLYHVACTKTCGSVVS